MATYIISVNGVCSDTDVYLDMTRDGEIIACDINFTVDDSENWACNCEAAKDIVYVLFRSTMNPGKAIKFLIENPKAKLYAEL